MATKTPRRAPVKGVGPAKGKTAVEAIVTGAAAAIALILVNVLACHTRLKVDLTEGGVYSLSSASKTIIRGMPEKVIIKAYFGNVPAEQSEKQNYVDMLLTEYADSSDGKIDYEKIDPWNNPDLQAELKKEGIDKMRLQSLRDDTYEQVPMYFQVVFQHLDKKEIWTPAQGFALEGLEYDFTSRIKRLGYGKKKVGVTTGFGEPPQAQVLAAPGADVMPGIKVGLGDLYDVTPIDWSKSPASIDALDILIVNGPTAKVSEAAKYHLDQFIMHGKPVLFLVSGMKWQSGGQQGQPEDPDQPYLGLPNDNGLGDLMLSYGFDVGKDVIIDGRNSARGVIPPGAQHANLVKGLFPYAESLQGGDKEILQGIKALALPFASTLKVSDLVRTSPDDVVTDLLRTSPQSFAHDKVIAINREMKLGPPDGEHGSYLVGVAVAGKFHSFYADKPMPAGADAPPVAPSLPQDGEADGPEPAAAPTAAPALVPGPAAGPVVDSVPHTRVVVISAPSIAADTTLTDIRQHGDMVYLNGFIAVHDVVDWLAEDTDLIAVRSKKIERPIAKMETGKRAVLKYGNIVGAPLILILFGVVFWRVRESRRRDVVL